MPFTTAVEIAMVNVPAVTFPSLEARLSTREERSGSFVVEVDELLLARARRGEQAAVERLYRTFERPVYNLAPVSYTHLRAHETVLDIVCRLLLEKKKTAITPTECLLPLFI